MTSGHNAYAQSRSRCAFVKKDTISLFPMSSSQMETSMKVYLQTLKNSCAATSSS